RLTMRKRRAKLSKKVGGISRFAESRFQPGAGEGPFLPRSIHGHVQRGGDLSTGTAHELSTPVLGQETNRLRLVGPLWPCYSNFCEVDGIGATSLGMRGWPLLP